MLALARLLLSYGPCVYPEGATLPFYRRTGTYSSYRELAFDWSLDSLAPETSLVSFTAVLL